MYSGQGSQYYNMAADFYEKDPIFREWMDKLDVIAHDIIGESIISKIYDTTKRKNEMFTRTLYTHPALFMVQFSLSKSLISKGIQPDYVLGTSLGEFVSIAISQVLSIRQCMECVLKQAQIFESYCLSGSMLAILHSPNIYKETPLIFENSELIGINFNSHFVISGESKKIKDIQEHLKNNNIISQMLPVSIAFHSSKIDNAKNAYMDVIMNKTYSKPSIPFVSSVYGSIVDEIPKSYLWEVARQPMEFPRTIEKLETKHNNIYIDLGPGGTLANFAKRNLTPESKSEIISIITPFGGGVNNIQKLKEIINKKELSSIKRKGCNMIAYVFPGQGSQRKGMGKDLFDEFKELTTKADDILGYSIKELCLEDPQQKLNQTEYTQPALFVVNAMIYLKHIKDTGRIPDYVAGHSLGEYNALFASEAFDFETGLKIVRKRGQLMSKAKNGGMAAVIGLTEEKIEEILVDNNLNNIDIANYNTPSQIVISGLKDEIEKAQPIFEKSGAIKYVILKTSGAFHSRYMVEARDEFKNYLDKFNLSKLSIPVISNVTARPYKLSEIKHNLIEQITSSVKWTESMRYLMGKREMEIEQIGPGFTLTGLVRAIKNEAQPLILDDEIENQEEIVGELQQQKVEVKVEEKVEEKVSAKTKTEDKGINKEIPKPKKRTKEVKSILKKKINVHNLGNDEFKQDYNIQYPCIVGSMGKGISSEEMVVKLGNSDMLGIVGTKGLDLNDIEVIISNIQRRLDNGKPYGFNLTYSPYDNKREKDLIRLYLKNEVRTIEVSQYINITEELVKYRLKGLYRNDDGIVITDNKIIAKVSRSEVVEVFLKPAPQHIVEKLFEEHEITKEQADMAKEVPMCDDLCCQALSAAYTTIVSPYSLLPAMIKLRDEHMKKYGYNKTVRVGAAGGIGTPDAVVASFILGADFILTGSINQCTVEADTSNMVKDILQKIEVKDTDYVSAGDMFEMGSKVQVVKKGVFFPARANKLYGIYRRYNSIDEIDYKTKQQIQDKYFKKTFEEVYDSIKVEVSSSIIEKAEQSPKYKMALIFRWYSDYTFNLALEGDKKSKVDYQIYSSSALGAFNQWVKGSELEEWQNRHVDYIQEKLMLEAEQLLKNNDKAI